MRFSYSVLILLLVACSLPRSEYVDVSHEQRFQGLLGVPRITKSDLLLLGIDSYPSKNQISYFMLMPRPGFEGPEVLSRSSLPSGSVVRIVGVESCTNCGSKSNRFVLEVEGMDRIEPVYLRVDFANELVEHNQTGGQ